MKFISFIALILSVGVSAQTVIPDDCPPDERKKLEAQILAEAVMNRDNNKCPVRTYPNFLADAKTVSDVKRIVDQKIKEVGLTPDWSAGTGHFSHWEAFTDADAGDMLKLKQLGNTLIYALNRYPKNAFQKMGVSKVLIAKNLTITPAGQAPQHRRGMPDPKTDTIIYSPVSNQICQADLEHTIHHELFHLIEGTVHKNMFKKDKKWQSLNSKNFSYGGGGTASYEVEDFKNPEHPRLGFVTQYATLGEEEDRAEVFGRIMTAGYASRLEGWATVDPSIQKKRQYIIDFMKTKVSKEMNEAYFQNVIVSE